MSRSDHPTALTAFRLSDKGWFSLGAALYLALGALLFPLYRYQLNPDGTSYLTIAEKYLIGDFSNAVNGLWGPLFSWLIVPLLAIGIDAHVAAKVVLLAAGLGVYFLMLWFAGRLGLESGWRRLLAILLVPTMLAYAFITTTPDLLNTAAFVAYFAVIFDPRYPERRFSGMLAGLAAGIAYLAKGFAFPFFLAHFILATVFHGLRSGRPAWRRLLRHYAVGMLIFAMVSGPWIMALSQKYGGFTTSTAGAYNHGVVGPDSKGQAILTEGLLPPPNPGAVSAWEDPSLLPVSQWSALESWRSFKHQLRLFAENFYWSIFVLQPPLAFLLLVAFAWRLRPRSKERLPAAFLLATFGLYAAGYAILHVEMRYFWPLQLLLMVTGLELIRSWVRGGLSGGRRVALVSLFVLSFLTIPLTDLIQSVHLNKDLHDVGEALEQKYGITGNLASDRYGEVLYIAFKTGSKFYGVPKLGSDDQAVRAELERHPIDYYLSWHGEVPSLKDRYPEITLEERPDLRIYQLRR
jgi:hypothetical protein